MKSEHFYFICAKTIVGPLVGTNDQVPLNLVDYQPNILAKSIRHSIGCV